jgi:beta-lactamase regulating signal transducer with metallopeptidase domain
VLLFSTPVISEIIRAISRTLVHSLWEGILLSIIATITIFSTRSTSPQVRYNLLLGALAVFIVAVATTFGLQFIKAKQLIDTAPIAPAIGTQITEPAMSHVLVANKISLADTMIAFVDANAHLIVIIWLLIISLQFVRLSTGLYTVYTLKNSQVFNAGHYWNAKIIELAVQLGINKKVQLLQSAIVKMPSLVGYFKPVILFPAGMLASLPPREIEAVLLHELAHVRRKDFLVNMLQQLVEIIFFFNPAVLWVSSLIKSERENCCDEIAIQQTSSKQNYINALLSFEAFNLPHAGVLTNAFNGEKKHLMNRIKRIIYNNNKTLNNMEKKFLAAGIIVTSVLFFSFSSNSAQPSTSANNSSAGITLQTDTVPAPSATDQSINGTINSIQNGKKYVLVTENNQVKELYIDGKKVPEEKIRNYQKVTGKILIDTKKDLEQSQKELAESANQIEQSKKEMEESKIEMEQSKKEMEESAKEIEQSNKETAEAAKQMMEDKAQAEKDIEQSQQVIAQSKVEMAQAKIEMEQAQTAMQQDMQKARRDLEQSQNEMVQAKKEMERAAVEMEQSKKEMEQSKLLQEKIIADFVTEGIIEDKSELSSYKLNNEALMVNGVKLPEAVFKKFRNNYVKSKHWSMEYNNKNEAK